MFGAPPCILELSKISNMHGNMIAMFVKASTLGLTLSRYLGISSSTNWESSGIHIHMYIYIVHIYIYITNIMILSYESGLACDIMGFQTLVPDNSKGESLGYTLDNYFGRSHCKRRDSLLGVNYMTTCKLGGAGGKRRWILVISWWFFWGYNRYR